METNQFEQIIKESIEVRLNDFYHEKVVPLEKEIIKLGGKLPIASKDIEFKLFQYRPLDPFKESKKIIHYWENEHSDYFKFFKSLFEECFERSWVCIVPPYNYEETLDYWMWVFGCKEKLNFILKMGDKEIVKAVKWKGRKNLCVYLINRLTENKYMTIGYGDEAIKNHFLPSSSTSTIANIKSKLKHNKPSKASEVDDVFDSLLKG